MDGQGPPKKRKNGTQLVRKEPQQQGQPKKRVRWQPKPGKLAGLVKMPLDILFDIFGHLMPQDILNLSRTTKDFRRILMRRSAKFVWKAAQENVPGLPSVPPGMVEPQWANLLYEQTCHVCITKTVRIVHWSLRIRICDSCAKTHLCRDVAGYMANSIRPPTVVPKWTTKDGEVLYFAPAYEAMKEKYDSLETADAREAFMAEQHLLMKEIADHAQICERWAKKRSEDRARELSSVKEARKQEIIAKLTALGWGDEMKAIPPKTFSSHKLVKLPQPLTPRIWSNIEGQMIQYMETVKASRLSREFAAVVSQRKTIAIAVLRAFKKSLLHETLIFPEPVDFCDMPSIKAVLDLPVQIVVDASTFESIVPSIAGLCDEWRAGLDQRLITTIQENLVHRAPKPFTKKDLTLATTTLRCRQCSSYNQIKIFYYPTVLGHRCLTRSERTAHQFDSPKYLENDMIMERAAWSSESLCLDVSATKVVEGIIKVCGLNLNTTTAEKMDNSDIRLGCLTCAKWPSEDGPAQVKVFKWRAAVEHSQKPDHTSRPTVWYMLGPEETRQFKRVESERERAAFKDYQDGRVQTLELENLIMHNNKSSIPALQFPKDIAYSDMRLRAWGCVHCCDLTREVLLTTLPRIMEHIIDRHDVDEPVMNRDYYKAFASPEVQRDRVTTYGFLSDCEEESICFSLRVKKPAVI